MLDTVKSWAIPRVLSIFRNPPSGVGQPPKVRSTVAHRTFDRSDHSSPFDTTGGFSDPGAGLTTLPRALFCALHRPGRSVGLTELGCGAGPKALEQATVKPSAWWRDDGHGVVHHRWPGHRLGDATARGVWTIHLERHSEREGRGSCQPR